MPFIILDFGQKVDMHHRLQSHAKFNLHLSNQVGASPLPFAFLLFSPSFVCQEDEHHYIHEGQLCEVSLQLDDKSSDIDAHCCPEAWTKFACFDLITDWNCWLNQMQWWPNCRNPAHNFASSVQLFGLLHFWWMISTAVPLQRDELYLRWPWM